MSTLTQPNNLAPPPLADDAHPQAPAPEAIPAYPASWYRFAESSQISDRPLSREMLGRLLVAFRDSQGKVSVLDGRCVHQGADLGRGAVKGDCLECPFHGWTFRADGSCARVPSSPIIPPFARLRTYPTVERHGSIFFFNGPEPLFPLPSHDGMTPEDFDSAAPFPIEYDSPWHAVIVNAFDLYHFQIVHDRKVISEARVSTPHRFARRIEYRVAVVGQSVADRFIRAFVGDTVDVQHTLWGGTVLLTRARFARADSYLYFAMRPTAPNRCVMETMVLRHRTRSGVPIIAPLRRVLSLWLRRRLTAAFMQHEKDALGSIRYCPSTMIDADRETILAFRWLADLPQT